jgi:hypothetical protein
MILAWIDTRPFIGIALVPVTAVVGYLLWRFAFRSSSWLLCQIAVFALAIAAYQFILFGPLIDQKRVVPVRATATWRPDIGPDVIGFTFPEAFGFGGFFSRDTDVAKRIRDKNLKDVEVAVELTYDFGRPRGMNFQYAYADGILFAPETK